MNLKLPNLKIINAYKIIKLQLKLVLPGFELSQFI